MVQEIIVVGLFIAAAAYMGWKIWKSVDSRNSGGCAKGCGCAEDKKMKAKSINI